MERYSLNAYDAIIMEIAEVAKKLAEIRNKAGLSVIEVSKALGYSSSTGYYHYESRYKKKLLPQDLSVKLATLFSKYGIPENEVLALGGIEKQDDQSNILPKEETTVNAVLLGRLIDITREESTRLGIALNSENEADVLSCLYEIAIIDKKDGKYEGDLRKDANSILRLIKKRTTTPDQN